MKWNWNRGVTCLFPVIAICILSGCEIMRIYDESPERKEAILKKKAEISSMNISESDRKYALRAYDEALAFDDYIYKWSRERTFGDLRRMPHGDPLFPADTSSVETDLKTLGSCMASLDCMIKWGEGLANKTIAPGRLPGGYTSFTPGSNAALESTAVIEPHKAFLGSGVNLNQFSAVGSITNNILVNTISLPAGDSGINQYSASGPILGTDLAIEIDQTNRVLDEKKDTQFTELTPAMSFPYIDAGQVTSAVPTSGLATYNGLLSGNSTGPGGTVSVSGTIRLTVDFASLQNPADSAIATQLNFADGMGSATGTMTAGALMGNPGSNGLSGTFRGESIVTGGLRDSQFFGPSANELGGNWNVQTNSNTGSGAYQSAR